MNPIMWNNMIMNNPLNQMMFMQMNQMKMQPNQMNQIGGGVMPNSNQFIPPGIQMIPMPIPMPMPMMNPLLAQQIYQQNMMQESETERLNNNYEFQLKRHKEAELYKVVNDKNNNNK